jgi:hypothetical protein
MPWYVVIKCPLSEIKNPVLLLVMVTCSDWAEPLLNSEFTNKNAKRRVRIRIFLLQK